jgi:hypothetical protein
MILICFPVTIGVEYSDIDFEPDGSECVRDYQEAHDYIMTQLLNKLIS